jgi:hemoglobin
MAEPNVGSEPSTTRPSAEQRVPTLFEWAGGMPTLERLTTRFYERVAQDPLLAPIFAKMGPDHPKHVAHFLAEVLRGPATYTAERGGHATMLSRHLGRGLTQTQRARWVALLLESADEIALPDDPEFRSAFVAYLEWGSRLAVINSQDGVSPTLDQPMPSWGWGEAKGPYHP